MNTDRHFSKFLIGILATALCLSGLVQAQVGVRVMPRGLDQMAQSAELIVHGSIISARVEPHPQYNHLRTVVVTMQVDDTLKGPASKTVTFRQYIWDIREIRSGAGYRKGEEMVLLLGHTSSAGFRNPVGLDQGRFRVIRDTSGNAMAVNGRGNAGLFASTEQRIQAKGLGISAKTSSLIRQQKVGAGPIPLADLKEAIHNFAGVTK